MSSLLMTNRRLEHITSKTHIAHDSTVYSDMWQS